MSQIVQHRAASHATLADSEPYLMPADAVARRRAGTCRNTCPAVEQDVFGEYLLVLTFMIATLAMWTRLVTGAPQRF